MIYANTFNLTGTTEQQQIVKEALDSIKFPWERLNLPQKPTEIGWRNLNDGSFLRQGPNPEEMIKAHQGDLPREHGDEHTPSGSVGEPLMGRLEGRKYIMGVFFPGVGSIYVDNLLVKYPGHAKTTVSAEIAHSVDEFLPLSDAQRQSIMTLLHRDNPNTDGHIDTWWEKVDYGAEYYNLMGESFMILFTYAYSDLPFEGAGDFVHHGSPEMAPDVRKIIGIERTDTQFTTTTTTTTANFSTTTTTTEAPESTTTTTTTSTRYFSKVGSTTYHDSHKSIKGNLVYFNTVEEAQAAGLKACKVCKPK